MSEISIKYLIKLEVLNKTKIIFEEFFVKKVEIFMIKFAQISRLKKSHSSFSLIDSPNFPQKVID